MPALSSNYEDLPFRNYNDTMLSGSPGWSSTGQYSNGTASYPSSTASSQSYYNRSALPSGRSHQNLPSLTEMNLAQGAPGYHSRPSQLSRHNPSSPYYCTSPTDPLDISYAKTSQNGYGPSLYSQTPRTPYTISANDYGPSMYDQCYYSNGTSWPPSMQCPTPGYGSLNSDTASLTSRRRRGNLPKQVTDILRAWFHEHLDHPYPTDEDKQMLMAKTNLSISQVSSFYRYSRQWNR